jgi:hypothetical protein
MNFNNKFQGATPMDYMSMFKNMGQMAGNNGNHFGQFKHQQMPMYPGSPWAGGNPTPGVALGGPMGQQMPWQQAKQMQMQQQFRPQAPQGVPQAPQAPNLAATSVPPLPGVKY